MSNEFAATLFLSLLFAVTVMASGYYCIVRPWNKWRSEYRRITGEIADAQARLSGLPADRWNPEGWTREERQRHEEGIEAWLTALPAMLVAARPKTPRSLMEFDAQQEEADTRLDEGWWAGDERWGLHTLSLDLRLWLQPILQLVLRREQRVQFWHKLLERVMPGITGTTMVLSQFYGPLSGWSSATAVCVGIAIMAFGFLVILLAAFLMDEERRVPDMVRAELARLCGPGVRSFHPAS